MIVISGFAYLRLGLAETRADLPPSRLESLLMTSAVHASVRREAPEMPNPIAPTEENLIAGGRLYLDGCAGCHGIPGKAKKEGGDVLFPPVPQLPLMGTEYTEAQIFWVINHGIPQNRDVCQWQVEYGEGNVDHGRVHQTDEFSPRACPGRAGQTKKRDSRPVVLPETSLPQSKKGRCQNA